MVSRVRKALGTRKVGHSGTLDPMATGVLVLGIGRATRLLTMVTGVDKEYRATIRLGWATDTDDVEGEPIGAPADCSAIDREAVRGAMVPLTGDIEQVPSTISALKIDGKRAHALARAGEQVVLKPRRVTVSRFEVLGDLRAGESGCVEFDVVVDCSSGTYVRALARDLGAALGVGGHLTALRRTSVGPFAIDEAVLLDDVTREALMRPGDAARRLLPWVIADDESARLVGNGVRLAWPRDGMTITGDAHAKQIAILDGSGDLLAVATCGSSLYYDAVFVGSQ